MRAAAANGARTILITARPEKADADIVVGTPLVDTSWCHTVGYVSPLLALTAIAGADRRGHAARVIEGTLAAARPLRRSGPASWSNPSA